MALKNIGKKLMDAKLGGAPDNWRILPRIGDTARAGRKAINSTKGIEGIAEAAQKASKPVGKLPKSGGLGSIPQSTREKFKAVAGSSLTDEQAGANLGGFAAESVSNFLDSGGWGRAARSAGKGAAAGAVTMGSMSALTGGDFWEGAGKGAVMGGLGGGLRGSIRQSSGAPEGSGTMDSLRHMNQRGNVSESVRTLARSQASAAKSAAVLRAGGKRGI